MSLDTWVDETEVAAEFFHYFRDAPGADAFDIHGGDSGLEGSVATRSLFQERGAERDVALTDLRNFDIQSAHGGLEGAGLETVAVSVALFDLALVGFGTDVGDSFEKHGCVHEEFADLRDGIFDAVFEKQVDEIGMLIILNGFVHGVLLFLVCTFSIKSWTGTNNPKREEGAAAEAADSVAGWIGRTYRQLFTPPRFPFQQGAWSPRIPEGLRSFTSFWSISKHPSKIPVFQPSLPRFS